MPYQGLAPIGFNSVSMVTAALGGNDGEVGTKVTVDGRDYVLVYNQGTTQISPGLAGVLASSATGYSVTVSSVSSADFALGVCRHATLTTGTYGYLMTKGITTVQLGTTVGVSQKGLVELGANGVFEPVSNTTANKAPGVGVALEAIATSASGSVFISCYG